MKSHKHKPGDKFRRKWTAEDVTILKQTFNETGAPCYELTGGHKITEGVLNQIKQK